MELIIQLCNKADKGKMIKERGYLTSRVTLTLSSSFMLPLFDLKARFENDAAIQRHAHHLLQPTKSYLACLITTSLKTFKQMNLNIPQP